jgi:Bifunctional DNA primase/polymerase, N-terminal/Primase C terminal 1 (PriCT-1)
MSTLPESTGLFPRSQPEWAAHRIATFPVTVTAAGVKKPAVKHYGKLGLRASAQLAQKRSFANIDGVGFMAGPHSKITVIDIDDPDERLLTEVLDRHGSTPFIVRTASGKHHAYYRHSNERRRIRPWRDLPLDLLGSGGFVIAPPTLISGKGAYEIIAGNLDDLRRLPPIHNLDLEPATEISSGPELIIPEKLPQVGQRNNGLWRHCMRHAQRCDQFDDLLDEARTFNMALDTPLSDSEVTNTAASAWGYTMHGLNRFGQHGVWSSSEEIAAMMHSQNQDAFLLLTFLRGYNGPHALFMCANALAEKFGWTRHRLAAARSRLIELNYIMPVRQAGRGNPALFRWTK